MKRSGANDTRRRTVNDDVSVARPNGPLTDREIEGIRRAYAHGCRGEVLIGLRSQDRVITMLLPPTLDEHSSAEQLRLSLDKLKTIGCDGYVRARRVLAR